MRPNGEGDTHHVVLGEDADNTVWVSSGGAAQGVVGWFNRKIYEEQAKLDRAFDAALAAKAPPD